MISFQKALQTILKEGRSLSSGKVRLRNALHRTLAEDVVAKENIPPFDNSAMDGFAVRSKDVRNATKKNSVTLNVAGESSAGNPRAKKMEAGEAIRIMTGAKVPDGADAIIPIELVKSADTQIHIASFVIAGAHIRRAGEDVRKNEVVLKKGEELTPAKIGLLASLGHSKVRVVCKPRVNILPTGDELVNIDDPLHKGQIRNSTSYALSGYVEDAGGEAAILGIVPDRKKKLRKAIKRALDGNIVLITGGVSVGKYDLVKDALESIGVKIKFWRVNIKPGKPLLFGTFGKTLVFGLPGNPASTGVTFLQFVRPAIRAMLRRAPAGILQLDAILDESVSKHDNKRHFVRGIVTNKNGQLRVRTTGTQSSGVLSSVARANCLIVIPEKVSSLKKGSNVVVEMT